MTSSPKSRFPSPPGKSATERANRRRHGRNCKKRQMPSGISARFSHKNLRTCAQRRANRQSPFCPRAFRRSLGHFCKHHGKKGIFSPNPRNSQATKINTESQSETMVSKRGAFLKFWPKLRPFHLGFLTNLRTAAACETTCLSEIGSN